MSGKLTDKACKAIIIRVAKEFDVPAKFITTRLMSEDDKNDMRNGDLPLESLKCHVKVWIENGLCDYAHGKMIPLSQEQAQGY